MVSSQTGRETSPALAVVHFIDRGILLLAQGVGLIAMVALFVAVFAGVMLRYLSDQGAAWVNEVPYLLFPWLCASGIVIAAQLGAHILVEFLVHQLPERMARRLVLFTQGLSAGLFAFLAFHGLTIIQITSAERYPTLGLPTAYAYSALVVACALLAVTAITTLLLAVLSERPPGELRKSEISSEGAS
ncbi:TRAP transporter small permease [Halomonas sp.]|uniref:TRAP transporter small permease n=1 Tax=Halomonas sp. TaxID=1486246 RepID=UPI00258DA35C|nr:TRAP transporter small permease [Halomonas sp.]MCJ8284438.1 TRAP transporter small permease [Halomonas sp.]NQY69492.1 TRAP transporter small permease [Halomonas sp.]